ncbi:hypothetical protein HJC23_005710 [Cyclotella cryptica]|uniref:ATP-grasp domain-containing protein n=1 Tax=Cyclotella cryptica TaxID=29204 RepID=A0ABD3QDV8_9STRA|eukprot:CCRYP_006420-RA/>CCRYP_006420-RA protein AED:0.01 eAED:0.01 QI:0/0/0/1/1/1/3/0/563
MTTNPELSYEEGAMPSISEVVLAAVQQPEAEAKEDPAFHGHTRAESFGVGAAFINLAAADKNTTISVLGDDGGALHKVVATEIVNNPVQLTNPPPILQNSILLIHPKLPDVTYTIAAAYRRNLMVTAVIPKVNDGTKSLSLHPTASRLLEAGVHQVYEPPVSAKFDVMECCYHLKTMEAQQNLRFLGVIPCRESSVDIADMLAALLGLRNGNDLGLSGARRDKGLMKLAVANAGLRVAKYARLTRSDGGEVVNAIKELELEFPVVVKTPRGWSTQDVYICNSMEDAIEKASKIVKSVGPDGRKTQYALLEEFLDGDEFAVNLIASPTTPRGVQVTDLWMYHKVFMHGTMVNTWQSMVDPHDKKYASLVRYGEGVCRAVGIKYGMAHIELKAVYDEKVGRWINPAMIEVGARLAGGRKAVMAEATIPGWRPFDAMVDAHCGFPVHIPPSFRPEKQAYHVYVPSDKEGIVTKIEGSDFERLPTYYAHAQLAQVGKRVSKSKELASFAAQLWLRGDPDEVLRDAKRARAEFKLEVEPVPEVCEDDTKPKLDEDEPIAVSPVSVPSV